MSGSSIGKLHQFSTLICQAEPKTLHSSSLVIEALGGYDPTGAMYARLAAEIPTVANGGISEDLTSITWKLKPGVLWSDGTPFTSADVVFTADYCIGEPGCYQEAKFEGVKSIDAVDDLTVKITFEKPMPNPYGPFVGSQTPNSAKGAVSELHRN